MKSLLKNNKGLTLVELLAVIVISSIIMIVLFSIFLNGQNQAQTQRDKNLQLIDVAYVLKVLTREIRKTDIVEVQNNDTLIIDNDIYTFNSADNTITKNGDVFQNNINQFQVNKVLNKITIQITSIDGITQKTEIVLRR
ncbi:hypothetical protein CD30_07350 [Ureibacillus massiliensis 4400831 = CIP 108448 = CCUG 49529]|uniref:Prepilin-type N-terminal cleavage/methylation domain-containing protein n=1 Tax=Ureibacillus massiliensis 4400831 = CIP 108448 = CCUG 49529 TaxID=1211035 RepID=A0A0A3JW69_9BACL|nr:prepilin-type N-terminal cleavage/methylation domain-containing protein [Ureibacillus massiliensis]KGR91247.1 hypothetical protein CD30_07350 [Ureibacillus massiliensis 4400831 = CIP 108448 = CCUG 49529]